MEFVRKKKRGVTGKTCKVWFSEDAQYKITWTKECFGVRVKPHFHATVLCLRNINDTERQWDFAGRHGPYKAFEAAQQACEHHQKMWLEAVEISEGEFKGRTDRLRTLEFRSRIKTVKVKKKHKTVTYQRTMSGVPVWVRNKANMVLTNFFFPRSKKRVEDEDDDECLSDPSATGEALPTTDPGSSTTLEKKQNDSSATSLTNIPASCAVAGEAESSPVASTKRRRKGSSATAVAETAACPKSVSKKSTKTSRTTTSRKSAGTKKRAKRAA